MPPVDLQKTTVNSNDRFTTKEIIKLTNNIFSLNRFTTTQTFDYVKSRTNLTQGKIQLIKLSFVVPIIVYIVWYVIKYPIFDDGDIVTGDDVKRVVIFFISIAALRLTVGTLYVWGLHRMGVIEKRSVNYPSNATQQQRDILDTFR